MTDSERPLSKAIMLSALEKLDKYLDRKIELIVGGGGAMILAHKFPLATTDIDAIPKGIDIAEIDPLIKKISMEMHLPGDWLNPYFASFSHTLPQDFSTRLTKVFSGKNLTALALGKEEMLIMKCFAGRPKDVAHAKHLIKNGADLKLVERQMYILRDRKIPNVDKAFEFLDDLLEQMG